MEGIEGRQVAASPRVIPYRNLAQQLLRLRLATGDENPARALVQGKEGDHTEEEDWEDGEDRQQPPVVTLHIRQPACQHVQKL